MNIASQPDARRASRFSLKPIERLIDALTDPARRERTAMAVLAIYAVAWTLYGVIAKSSQDVQFDAAELVGWSREPALGYAKHPPLAAWLVRGWFSLFPIRDWSYYLFAMIYAAIGLWIAWRLFERFLDPGKRILALACLTLVPYFNFHGLRFDHNAILGPLWAAATLCFIRSFETRSATWAVLAGVAGAAAMLGKYWSIFLIAGFLLAALVDARRGLYFRSAAPWITMAVGALLLAPHIGWLFTHDFMPFTYATAKHTATTFVQTLTGVAGFLGGGTGYAAGPLIMALAAAQPNRAAAADMLLPREPERRLAAVLFWAPLLLPPVVSLLFGFELNSIWTMPGLILLPVVLLSSPAIVVARRTLVWCVAIAVALPAIMLVASPAIAVAIHLAGVTPAGAHAELLAKRIEQEWRQSTDRPLRIVGGNFDLAYAATFYMPEQPSVYPVNEANEAPWITPERVAREGGAFACLVAYDLRDGHKCEVLPVMTAIDKIAARNPASRQVEIVLTRSYLGIAGKPSRYRITIVPPRP